MYTPRTTNTFLHLKTASKGHNDSTLRCDRSVAVVSLERRGAKVGINER
jgi:hypothetical protein